ncbi:NAD/ferredoxin-dependent reductase-like protein [Branchiibius hedensis]|uniref:Reductase C-terminal n=1 Tax=Branchiibius hedensis TaxID=672460 RepID=A0A2Y8ZLX5_9MICO|nr:FAD-dependent oxidoreductase [Branchiibius hedensis]PWJ23946.1 NAD/ferredoxin-dependent reductase-like protein [Branchiibius hedensis]SSA32764.1 Reductase C-terminal [Branchiibius hedensis]
MPAGLVVVGASLAGLRAVEAARKSGYAGPITLIGAEPHLPYDRPPLSKDVLAQDKEPPDTTFRTQGHLRDELGVRVLLSAPAIALDPAQRSVMLADGEVPYEQVVVATGAVPRSLPGYEDHPQVLALRTVDDAHTLRAAMAAGARVLVVGCGFIGSEVASALIRHGGSVTMVELADVPLVRAVGEETGAYFAQLHRDNGVDLRLSCKVQQITESTGGLAVSLSDGSSVEADLVVVGLGAVPATSWLTSSGIGLELDQSVSADAGLRTTLPDVYAAGDVVTWENGQFGRRMRLEHWTSAAEQGAVAARNAVGGQEQYETVPYFWSDLHGKRIQFVGVHGTTTTTVQDADSRVVLYHADGTLLGALTVAQPRLTMKLRKIIAGGGPVADALALLSVAGLR